jgi:hypothetical protein
MSNLLTYLYEKYCGNKSLLLLFLLLLLLNQAQLGRNVPADEFHLQPGEDLRGPGL